MRTTRAFIAGLGTTSSLVAATACAFLVSSALVAFNGWPGGGIPDNIGSLFVHEAPVAVASAGPEGVAAGSTAAAEAVVSTPFGRVSHHPAAGVIAVTHASPETPQFVPAGGPTLPEGGGGLGGGPGGGEDNGPGGPSSGSEAGTQPVAPQPPFAESPRSPKLGTSVSETTGQLGDTVSNTTNQVGEAVGGPVGEVVTGVGQVEDDVVTNVGHKLGEILGQ